MVAMALKSSVKFPFSSAVATWLIAAVIFASSSEDRDEPFVMDLNAFCSTGVTASVAIGSSSFMPSRMCPLDALAIAACATGGTPPSSAIALKIAVKLPVVNAVDTSLRAIVSLVCSSGVNMFVPLPNDANDLFSTGVIAWVAIGISALAPSSTFPFVTFVTASTPTGGTPPRSAMA